jgi:hypothetical protein
MDVNSQTFPLNPSIDCLTFTLTTSPISIHQNIIIGFEVHSPHLDIIKSSLKQYVAKAPQNANIVLLAYGLGTKYLPLSGSTDEIIDNIGAPDSMLSLKQKGVSFCELCGSLADYFENNNIPTTVIILNSSRESVSSIPMLKGFIDKLGVAAKTKPTAFHTIGIESKHDAALLDIFTKCSSTRGSYQYAREETEIAPALLRLTSETLSPSAYIYNGEQAFVISLTPQTPTQYQGQLFGKIPTGSKIIINTGTTQQEFPLNPTEITPSPLTHSFSYYSFLLSKLQALSSYLAPQIDKKTLTFVKEIASISEKEVQELSSVTFTPRYQLHYFSYKLQHISSILEELNLVITSISIRNMTVDRFACFLNKVHTPPLPNILQEVEDFVSHLDTSALPTDVQTAVEGRDFLGLSGTIRNNKLVALDSAPSLFYEQNDKTRPFFPLYYSSEHWGVAKIIYSRFPGCAPYFPQAIALAIKGRFPKEIINELIIAAKHTHKELFEILGTKIIESYLAYINTTPRNSGDTYTFFTSCLLARELDILPEVSDKFIQYIFCDEYSNSIIAPSSGTMEPNDQIRGILQCNEDNSLEIHGPNALLPENNPLAYFGEFFNFTPPALSKNMVNALLIQKLLNEPINIDSEETAQQFLQETFRKLNQ